MACGILRLFCQGAYVFDFPTLLPSLPFPIRLHLKIHLVTHSPNSPNSPAQATSPLEPHSAKMEHPCTAKQTFYHVCSHVKVEAKHLFPCPEVNCTTSFGCTGISVSTFIVNSLCPWCKGEEPLDLPQYHQFDESTKERRRREFEEIVRKQMVECEVKASEPKAEPRLA